MRTATFQFSDSGGSVNGPDLFTELPFPVEILTKPLIHWMPPPFSLKNPFFFCHWEVLRRIPRGPVFMQSWCWDHPKLPRKIPSFSQNDIETFLSGGYPNRSSGIHRWGLDLSTGYPSTYFSWYSGYTQLTLLFYRDTNFSVIFLRRLSRKLGSQHQLRMKTRPSIPFPKIGSCRMFGSKVTDAGCPYMRSVFGRPLSCTPYCAHPYRVRLRYPPLPTMKSCVALRGGRQSRQPC